MKKYYVIVDTAEEYTITRWYSDAKCTKHHREDGPAVENSNGTKMWWINGRRHREDGPAVEWADGTKYWFVDGKRHRLDGPAVEGANGRKMWVINDEELTEEEFLDRTQPIEELTVAQIEQLLGKRVKIVK